MTIDDTHFGVYRSNWNSPRKFQNIYTQQEIDPTNTITSNTQTNIRLKHASTMRVQHCKQILVTGRSSTNTCDNQQSSLWFYF